MKCLNPSARVPTLQFYLWHPDFGQPRCGGMTSRPSPDGVQEFLDLGVASLGIGQDFADEVHGMLHFEGMSLFFSLYHQGGADQLHGGRNVE